MNIKFFDKYSNHEAYKTHLQKLNQIKPMIDIKSPKTANFTHMRS